MGLEDTLTAKGYEVEVVGARQRGRRARVHAAATISSCST